MQLDFHYYATYCAAFLAGYPHEECLAISYSDQFTDVCTRTLLSSIGAPLSAATTQLQLELADVRTDIFGLQDITRIWASFHFLPFDLYADPGRKCGRRYRNKYRLICNSNGELVKDTVVLAKDRSLQAAGLAMHVLADTWAHKYFAGTPSIVINNVGSNNSEVVRDGDALTERPLKFALNPLSSDDPERGVYINTIYQMSENSIMNLGHGRAGHLPDYSFARYKYLPAWGDYEKILKDNPSDYYHAFTQMIYALEYLRGFFPSFETERYDTEAAAPYEEEIRAILEKRQTDACADWKAFAEKLSGRTIPDFDGSAYLEEYKNAPADEKNHTFLGRYIIAALSQKSMVTNRIHRSGNLLAGYSVDYGKEGFKGIGDYKDLVTDLMERMKK